jgi:hypothetical protein
LISVTKFCILFLKKVHIFAEAVVFAQFDIFANGNIFCKSFLTRRLTGMKSMTGISCSSPICPLRRKIQTRSEEEEEDLASGKFLLIPEQQFDQFWNQ